MNTANQNERFAPEVDWLTLATYRFTAYTDTVAQIMRHYSQKRRPGRWLQYDGWKIDGLFWGHALQSNGREHYIVRVSGAYCTEFLSWFLPSSLADSFYSTRVDLQVTNARPDWWNVRQEYDRLTEEGRAASMIESETGSTLYIGSRTSDRFCRIYEKELGGCKMLRLEIECKGDLSKNVWGELLQGASVADMYLSNLVRLKLGDRIQDYYAPKGADVVVYSTVERQLDMEKKLAWLVSLVPSIDKLVNDHTVGERARDVLAAILFDKTDASPHN